MRPTHRLFSFGACLLTAIIFAFPVASQEQAAPTAASRTDASKQIRVERPPAGNTPHVHNLLRLTDTIYSGGEPDSDAAFAELTQLGIKTIISVDGAEPNLATAK